MIAWRRECPHNGIEFVGVFGFFQMYPRLYLRLKAQRVPFPRVNALNAHPCDTEVSCLAWKAAASRFESGKLHRGAFTAPPNSIEFHVE